MQRRTQVPLIHSSLRQLTSGSLWQVTQATPLSPHAALVFPSSQVVPAQQPVGHVPLVQTQVPPSQT